MTGVAVSVSPPAMLWIVLDDRTDLARYPGHGCSEKSILELVAETSTQSAIENAWDAAKCRGVLTASRARTDNEHFLHGRIEPAAVTGLDVLAGPVEIFTVFATLLHMETLVYP